MFSCWHWAVARASAKNRAAPIADARLISLIATRRANFRSRAKNTVPIPPRPISRISSYWRMRVPGPSVLFIAGRSSSRAGPAVHVWPEPCALSDLSSNQPSIPQRWPYSSRLFQLSVSVEDLAQPAPSDSMFSCLELWNRYKRDTSAIPK